MNVDLDSRQDYFRRVISNFFILLGGRAAGGILFFLATMVSARLLEPRDLGFMVILHAYVMMVRGIVTVRPFEAIVKYGTTALDNFEFDRLGRLFYTSLKLDLASALIGTAVAIFGLKLLIKSGHFDAEYSLIGYTYCLLILLASDSTAVGALRILNKFNTISYCLVFGAIVRLAGMALIYKNDMISFNTVASVWFISSSVQYLLLQVTGWRQILHTLPKSFSAYTTTLSSCGKENDGIWKFLHIVYWQSSLDLIPKRAGILFSGFLLSPESAAMFRIASDLSGVLSKPAQLVRQAIFPDLTRLREKKDGTGFLNLALKVALTVTIPAALLGMLSIWFGEELISLTFGSTYNAASTLLTLLVISATFELAGSPLRPLLYASDNAGYSLATQVFATLAYIVVFVTGTTTLALLTPGIASITLNFLVLVLSVIIIFCSNHLLKYSS